MAGKDLNELFLSGLDEFTPDFFTFPRFPGAVDISRAFPHMRPGGIGLGKGLFVSWIDPTMEAPDEIWADESPEERRTYFYLSFLEEIGAPPLFAVAVRRVDDFTELNDFTLILDDASLEALRSGHLVYSSRDEWARESRVRRLNDSALRSYDEGRLEEAGRLIELAIGFSGFSAAYLYNNRGLINWKKGDTDQAKLDFQEAARLDDSNGDPHYNLGLIYFDEGDYSKALDHLEEAVRINPGDAQFLVELGHLYLSLDRETDALRLFQKALETNPGDSQVDFHLGHYFLYRKNMPKKAVGYYRRGLTKDPEDQYALADLAVAHLALGNRRRSFELRRLLQDRRGLQPYTVSRLVYLNLAMGDYEAALRYYHRAITLNEPYEPEWLHYNAALAYANIGRPRKAVNSLCLAVQAGGEPVLDRAMGEKALDRLRQRSDFKRLMKIPERRRNRSR
jgi:tetratricopeptide (TPR) repeat protein